MEIEKQYDEIARCNRCGFCQVACPIFRATGHEAGVARGRVALLRALVEKRIEWDAELEEPLFSCLLCGACTANCFPGVKTADMVTDARGQYLDRVGRSRIHKLLFQRLLPYPRRLRLAAKAAAFGKRTGLSKVARALGLLRGFGRDFARAEGIVERFPEQAYRESIESRVVEGAVQDGSGKRIGYFVGCGSDIMCPEAAGSTVRILKELAREVHVLENCCCGLPPMTYGDRTAAQNLAGKNIRLLSEGDFDVVVTDCSSCAAFLKKYPQLFEAEDPRRQGAMAVAQRVRDVLEFVGPKDRAGAIDAGESVVATYHDPCHAARSQGLSEEPRKILRSLPGIEYRELPEADWCCGGAGSYALAHYDLSQQVLDRKMEHVRQTGAKLLVTSCPACIIQLTYGVRKHGLPVRVCHISEVMASTRNA
jgi:glycolate oxidase iron-sulfur subunit